MHRRQFLMLASVSTLAACASFDTTLESVASDVSVIAQGLQGVMPAIMGIPDIAIEVIGIINSAIADLEYIADQIKAATTTVAAQPLVEQVEVNLNAIVSALARIPMLPPVVQVALQAAAILLPVIESAVHLIASSRLTAQAATAHLTPDQARALLRDLAPQD